MHGDGVEVGETVEDAARRELREETGLNAGRLALLGVYSGDDMLYTYPNGDQDSSVGIANACDDFSGEPQAEAAEVAERR